MKALKIIGLIILKMINMVFNVMWFFVKSAFYILFFGLLIFTIDDGRDEDFDFWD